MAGRAVNAIQRFMAGQKLHSAAKKVLSTEGKAPEYVQKPSRGAVLSAMSARDAAARGDKPAAKRHAAASREQANEAQKRAAKVRGKKTYTRTYDL